MKKKFTDPMTGEELCGWDQISLCKEAGVSATWLRKHVLAKLPEPQVRGKKKRYWSQDQVVGCLRIIDEAKSYQRMYSLADVGRLCDCPTQYLCYYISQGLLPVPQKTSCGSFWTETEAKEAKRLIERKRYARNYMVNLSVGLKELGATRAELAWAQYHQRDFPQPDLYLGTRKGKFYERKKIALILKQIRLQRVPRK